MEFIVVALIVGAAAAYTISNFVKKYRGSRGGAGSCGCASCGAANTCSPEAAENCDAAAGGDTDGNR